VSASVPGGTRNYAPLEQIWGTGTDPRSDLYSLAATLYHLLTGQLPTDAGTRLTEISQGGADPLRRANKLNPRVNTRVADALQQAMSISCEQRFSNAAEMRAALHTKQPGHNGTGTETLHSTIIDLLRSPTTTAPVVHVPDKKRAAWDSLAVKMRERRGTNYSGDSSRRTWFIILIISYLIISYLPQECAVSGYVQDTQGKPVSGALVTATLNDSDGVTRKERITTTTNATGGYKIQIKVPGRYNLETLHTAYKQKEPENVLVEPDKTSTIYIILGPSDVRDTSR